MALIYRCDRCNNDYPDPGYLHPISIGREDARRDDINDNRIKRFPIKADLCGQCTIALLNTLEKLA